MLHKNCLLIAAGGDEYVDGGPAPMLAEVGGLPQAVDSRVELATTLDSDVRGVFHPGRWATGVVHVRLAREGHDRGKCVEGRGQSCLPRGD